MAGTSRSGRKSKPTALKVLQGNAGKRKINAAEPEADTLSDAPIAPEWLDEIAKAMWDRTAQWLVGAKILTDQDLHNLEAFCMAYSRWREAETHVTKHGHVLENPTSGVLYKNPSLTVINETKRQMINFGSALGLDPSSRSRLAVPDTPGDNPFSELLNKRKGVK